MTNLATARANRLLALLPGGERERLSRHMTRLTLNLHDVVYHAHGPIDYVYFPHSGVLSILAIMSDGAMCEIGVAGSEGLVHVVAGLGARLSPHRVICQVEAVVDRLPVAAFREELARNGKLRAIVDAYTQYTFLQVSQTTACNSHHTVPARCARWLLMTRDRVDADQFPLTHEFLSNMLGLRRPSVTIALADLQRAGLISYTRGRITIADRAGLEALACECYGLVQKSYEMLIN